VAGAAGRIENEKWKTTVPCDQTNTRHRLSLMADGFPP
jgi:hypothetical protein